MREVYGFKPELCISSDTDNQIRISYLLSKFNGLAFSDDSSLSLKTVHAGFRIVESR